MGIAPPAETLPSAFFPRRCPAPRGRFASKNASPRVLRCAAPQAGSSVLRFPSRSRHREGIGPREDIRRKTMTAIGYVTKLENGSYKGQLKTVSIRADIDIVPNRDKSAET